MTLLQSHPAAVVIFGSQLADKTYQILERTNIPIVNVVGSYFKGAKITLEAAFFESAYELTRHLLERGYQHIGYLGRIGIISCNASSSMDGISRCSSITKC